MRDTRPTYLWERVKLLSDNKPPWNENALRDYGIGAQILLDLGVRNMVLLSHTTRPIVGIDGYGLNVVERRTFETATLLDAVVS